MSPCDSKKPFNQSSPLTSEGFFVCQEPDSRRETASWNRKNRPGAYLGKNSILGDFSPGVSDTVSIHMSYSRPDSPNLEGRHICRKEREALVARRNDLRTKIPRSSRLVISHLRCRKSGELNTLSELLTELTLNRWPGAPKITSRNMFMFNDIHSKSFGLARNFSGWHMPCI